MTRKIGLLLMELGTVLVILALALLLYNQWQASQAQEAATEVVSLLDEAIEENSSRIQTEDEADGEMDIIEIDGYEYIGTLTIDRFGLELPVMSEWSYAGMKIAPGRYNGSVWSDDLVICGHNYSRHFGNLKSLEAGDTLYFTDVNGNVFYYEVTEVATLAPTDVEEMVSRAEDEWDLTLFTCTIGGQARVTVRCSSME
ncbi:MAG: sortase [Clostridiales bacterium]|nr:sortase [Clostridiales bacterium]